MGRPTVIDRDRVLDSAEALVRSGGISRLTIAAVAKAAGISKGGVQSCFGTKEQLIRTMFERWSAEFEAAVAALAGRDPNPLAILRAHVEATRSTDEAQTDRAAGLMSALINADELRHATNDWYRARLALLDASTPAGRRARLAFLATEGVFLLRCFGWLAMENDEWQAVFDDIGTLLRAKDETPDGCVNTICQK